MTVDEAYEMIRAVARDSEPGHWADLGCGSGVFTYALARALPAQSLILAIDIERQSLKGEAYDVRIEFSKADFAKPIAPIRPEWDFDGQFLSLCEK